MENIKVKEVVNTKMSEDYNTKKKDINIADLVKDMNNKSISKKEVSVKYDMSDSRIKRLLKKNAYEYNSANRKYENTNSRVDGTKVTYRMSEELYKAIKLQAVFEGVTSTDIVTKALNKYIPQSTKDVVAKNSK